MIPEDSPEWRDYALFVAGYGPQYRNIESGLYTDYARQFSDFNPNTGLTTDNPNYKSTAFGEAKGANFTNYYGGMFGPTPDYIPDWLDTAISAPQTLATGIGIGAYQLASEAYKADDLLSTDWMSKAGRDWSEEMRGYNAARQGRESIDSIEDAWRVGSSVDDSGSLDSLRRAGYTNIINADTENWVAPTGINENWEKTIVTKPLTQANRQPNAGVANLGYTAQQLAGTQPAGLEKQNLDYALSQLGMMTGGAGSTGTVGSGGVSNPGFNAPYGGATPGGGYTNPFTGTDSAGRTQDDPYYGGDSDYGTAGGEGFGYSTSNAWTNYGRDVAGFLPGSMFTQPIGDAMMGLSPVPFAGNYVPGTDTYIPEYLTNYVGPGDVTTDVWGLGTGEQRDMMIEQGRLGGGMLGGASADPDQQFFESQQEALTWHNKGVAVVDPDNPGTAEAVAVANDIAPLEGSSFGSTAEAQAIANHGFGSDQHLSALEADGNQQAIDLLTPPPAPVATVPEAPAPAPAPSSNNETSDSNSGTSSEDLGGTSTTVDDAYDEISSGYDDPSDSSGSSGGDSGGGGCFITTATLQEVDTKDDGKELTTFRDFRDNYLSKKSYGGALVRDYYDTAPKVVEVINNRENHKQLYQSIWKEHLNPINKLIEKGDNAEATSKYMLMMEELKEKFLPRKGEGL